MTNVPIKQVRLTDRPRQSVSGRNILPEPPVLPNFLWQALCSQLKLKVTGNLEFH